MAIISETRGARFLATLHKRAPLFAKQVDAHAHARPEEFFPLAERLIACAESVLGDAVYEHLADGYVAFVLDVTRAQAEYERTGHYRHSTYDEIKREVYDTDYMRDYHWGMLATLFCWEHHIELIGFFRESFVEPNRNSRELLDLGCGSGAWSLLALAIMTHANATLVDIPPYVVEQTIANMRALGMGQVRVEFGNALDYLPKIPCDALISCYVAAHLECPQDYFIHMASLLKPGIQAFAVVAISAAESDHIYEFTSADAVVTMVEKSGLRIVKLHQSFASSGPKARYIPSALALVVEASPK